MVRLSGPANQLQRPGSRSSSPSAPPPPRHCYERKRYPDGRSNRFMATLLQLRVGHGVLHFVSDRAYLLGGVFLPRGTVTFGLFWEDRPYNLYAWMEPTLAAPRALYFNLCDQVSLRADRFDWRDLWVDLLVTPGARPRVLDRDEIPADVATGTRRHIERGVQQVLAEHRAVAAYLRALLPSLRARSARSGRR